MPDVMFALRWVKPLPVVNESAPRSRPFFRRVKFLRLDGATLTDVPAEGIVPRDLLVLSFA